MSVITPSIAAFLGRRSRLAAKRRGAPDLAAEIPPEMLAQLRRDGLRLVTMLPFLTLGLVTAIYIVMNFIAFDPTRLDHERLGFMFLVQVGVSLLLYRMIMRAGIKREVRFREQHGKWRWER